MRPERKGETATGLWGPVRKKAGVTEAERRRPWEEREEQGGRDGGDGLIGTVIREARQLGKQDGARAWWCGLETLACAGQCWPVAPVPGLGQGTPWIPPVPSLHSPGGMWPPALCSLSCGGPGFALSLQAVRVRSEQKGPRFPTQPKSPVLGAEGGEGHTGGRHPGKSQFLLFLSFWGLDKIPMWKEVSKH